MGIQNLLPLLEKSTRPCHVSEFRGHSIAVDSYCWLHKGARSCALQLAKGEETDMYVTFCMKYVNLLLSYDIKPIMVFDGRHLPAKMKTEEKRRETKKQARKQGIELLRLGKVNEAWKFFKQCVDITPEMALRLIKECRKLNVDCIVAPYESDAQLAFFSLKNIVECVISEDSDLLLFGCKKVLYKMDINGVGQLVEADKLYLSMKVRQDQYSFDKFRYMCILSGCDYIDSLPGIGLKKALKFISMTAENNPEVFLDKLPRYLNMRHLNVDKDYKESFMTADATFKYQIVYDPFQNQLVPLNPVQTKIEYCKNSGNLFNPEDAFQLALGNINPLTMEKIDDWQPTNSILSIHSIWSNCFTPRPLRHQRKSESEPKSKEVKVAEKEVIEKANLEYDLQMEREIEFYRKIPVEVKNSEALEESKPVSPVLGSYSNIPFIKKKISKFNRTTGNVEQKVVKSRFFTSNSGISEEDINFNDKTELNGVEALPTPPTENSDVVTLCEVNDTEYMQQFTALTPDENFDIIPDMEDLSLLTPDRDSDTMNPFEANGTENYPFSDFNGEDDMIEVPFIECECILEVSDTELEFPQDLPTLTSVENILEEPITKKRKLEPESGLAKKKKQVTIQDMFKRMCPK